MPKHYDEFADQAARKICGTGETVGISRKETTQIIKQTIHEAIESSACEKAWCERWKRICTDLENAKASIRVFDDRDIRIAAMNIVNQVLDASEASVEKRQSINDRCDEMAIAVITQLIR